ncbi:MAG: 5-formyltetrahydrofolate cyclo-ligase [Haliea sp.]|nr:5-formyltetrahydrofolate cyclo-ligase [Haliea sp.]
MSTDAGDRAALRRKLRSRRSALDATFRAAAAASAAAHITRLPGWAAAQRVALYWPNDGEIDTTALIQLCRKHNKQVYLPVLAPGSTLVFRAWLPDQPLLNNRFNIPEPGQNCPEHPVSGLDILILPVVGWQRDGCRLGMGGGFYDRTLASVEGPRYVGLAYQCQEITGLAMERWDVGLEYVLTETGLQRLST